MEMQIRRICLLRKRGFLWRNDWPLQRSLRKPQTKGLLAFSRQKPRLSPWVAGASHSMAIIDRAVLLQSFDCCGGFSFS